MRPQPAVTLDERSNFLARARTRVYVLAMNSPWDPTQSNPAHELMRDHSSVLQDMRVRFGVTLSCPRQAEGFAYQWRKAFPRSSATVIDNTAWCIFGCGAVDGHDAALQAAAAVKTITKHKLVDERPQAVHFNDIVVSRPVHAYDLERAARAREEALRKAVAWKLLDHPLVEGAVAAQLAGRRMLLGRQTPPGPRIAGPSLTSAPRIVSTPSLAGSERFVRRSA